MRLMIIITQAFRGGNYFKYYFKATKNMNLELEKDK